MTDKRRFPDPQELAIFLEVAKQRSFSQAALRLGVTTSSVSQSVTHLEKSLDATLVNRAHRPIELTCAGDRLYRKSGPILNELERTVRELKPAPGFYPEVRLGLSESVSGTLSPCLLQKYPNGFQPHYGEHGVHEHAGEKLPERRNRYSDFRPHIRE